jgi:hypothetical protein
MLSPLFPPLIRGGWGGRCGLLTFDFRLPTNRYLLDLSIRVIFVRPHAWQTETAFVDHAVLKFIRGPTSTTTSPLSSLARVGIGGTVFKKLLSEKFSGSNVSERSQRRI